MKSLYPLQLKTALQKTLLVALLAIGLTTNSHAMFKLPFLSSFQNVSTQMVPGGEAGSFQSPISAPLRILKNNFSLIACSLVAMTVVTGCGGGPNVDKNIEYTSALEKIVTIDSIIQGNESNMKQELQKIIDTMHIDDADIDLHGFGQGRTQEIKKLEMQLDRLILTPKAQAGILMAERDFLNQKVQVLMEVAAQTTTYAEKQAVLEVLEGSRTLFQDYTYTLRSIQEAVAEGDSTFSNRQSESIAQARNSLKLIVKQASEPVDTLNSLKAQVERNSRELLDSEIENGPAGRLYTENMERLTEIAETRSSLNSIKTNLQNSRLNKMWGGNSYSIWERQRTQNTFMEIMEYASASGDTGLQAQHAVYNRIEANFINAMTLLEQSEASYNEANTQLNDYENQLSSVRESLERWSRAVADEYTSQAEINQSIEELTSQETNLVAQYNAQVTVVNTYVKAYNNQLTSVQTYSDIIDTVAVAIEGQVRVKLQNMEREAAKLKASNEGVRKQARLRLMTGYQRVLSEVRQSEQDLWNQRQ